MANTIKLGNGNWATKEGSLLAYNDENNNFKPLPFTTTRASSATVVNKQGLIETVGSGIPRIDFSDDANGALLLEATATNLFTYSELFSNASWQKSQATLTITNEISPNGTTNNVYNYVGYNSNLYTTSQASGAEYTISFYVKSNGQGADGFKLRLGSGHSASLSATSEWVRHTFTATPATNVFSIASDGVGDVNILVWGAQLEQKSYATSYIPTQGGVVTRTVEYSKILNQPILKATNKFTMFFDAPKFLEVNGGVGDFDNVMLNLGASESAYDSGGGLHIYNKVWYYFSGSVATNIGICYNSLTDSKFAISYDGTSFHRYANGVKIGSIALSASMVNWDTFQTGGMNDAQLDERSWNLKNLKLYNTALSDSELAILTTI